MLAAVVTNRQKVHYPGAKSQVKEFDSTVAKLTTVLEREPQIPLDGLLTLKGKTETEFKSLPIDTPVPLSWIKGESL